MPRIQFTKQHYTMDCGPACLKMVASYYGQQHSLSRLRELSYLSKNGVSLAGISAAAESIGFRTLGVRMKLVDKETSLLHAPLPAIAHWNSDHFVVIVKASLRNIVIYDPASGKQKLTHSSFLNHWTDDGKSGIVLLLEPRPDFDSFAGSSQKHGIKFIIPYLKDHRKLLAQLVIGFSVALLFQLAIPFTTQAYVDFGILDEDLSFVYLILVAQLILFVSLAMVQFIQGWIVLFVGTKFSISLISDFLTHLVSLPIQYFDTKHTGDILQRIGDHYRIESFFTTVSIKAIFSLITVVIFSIVLIIYSRLVFFIYIISTAMYFAWISYFLKRRREIDYLAFNHLSQNQDNLIELIQGVVEIKLQNSSHKRRWKWMSNQAELFRANRKSLAVSQYQDGGALVINRFRDITISAIVAMSVINGSMSIGMLLAVQYVIGQIQGSMSQIVGFVRQAQDAKISATRLGDVLNEEPEEGVREFVVSKVPNSDIIINNLAFRYTPLDDFVLLDVNLTIPAGKTTALVGKSGCGKTTMLKLLMHFYEPSSGSISIGRIKLDGISKSAWRQKCGCVLQDGYIFADTIANNIGESEMDIDVNRVYEATRQANISDFIESLPKGYNTMIGSGGTGLSSGQKQRILIARAIYKNPDILIFDEATNALDAVNEAQIMTNIYDLFKSKTVVVAAHRLSTVRNADQIVVLSEGRIVEIGSHSDLLEANGEYAQLIESQLS